MVDALIFTYVYIKARGKNKQSGAEYYLTLFNNIVYFLKKKEYTILFVYIFNILLYTLYII